MADFIKKFMASQDHPFVLHLNQEMLDFKTWVKGCSRGCLRDGLEILVGHTYMHLFHFFVDFVRWPAMQYNMSLLMPFGVLRMDLPSNCGKQMI